MPERTRDQCFIRIEIEAGDDEPPKQLVYTMSQEAFDRAKREGLTISRITYGILTVVHTPRNRFKRLLLRLREATPLSPCKPSTDTRSK
jgi:hypothetical protein